MAAIHELLKQVQDPALRARLTEEFARATQNKKFGLVFEEHMPECTPLYGIGIKRGGTVAKKASKINDTYTVIKLNGDTAVCRNRTSGETEEIAVSDLVAVAEFGEPIFPCLEHIDSVENAPDSDLWHTLIEADNYHALQLLEYLYPHKVDCIYIDPPYNTRAHDWKYNNDYVDPTDSYKHSKWLSMMKKRLRIAKRLLKEDGVLVITIDDNEHANLCLLLKDAEMFPDKQLFSVAIQHNPRGTQGGKFAVSHETAVFVVGKDSPIYRKEHVGGDISNFRKWGNQSERSKTARATTFFPVIVDNEMNIVGFGEVLPLDEHPEHSNVIVGNRTYVYPIDSNNIERKWRYSKNKESEILSSLEAVKTEDGIIDIQIKRESENTLTVWTDPLYNAEEHGTKLVSKIVGNDFPFPKSLYAEHDTLWHIVSGKPDALIIDFFAGSGTTLHAVNLLNAEDNGHRRCIIVTNNECSKEDEDDLKSRGYQNGDAEWEKHGICKSVTWPRTKNSILGCREDGVEIDGEYFTTITNDIEKSRSFTHIGFVKDAAAMKPAEKKQLLALFAKGVLPQNLIKTDTKFIVSDNEKHTISVLFDDTAVDEWLEALDGMDHITDFYIVTEKKATFNAIKDRVTDVLGNIIVQEQVKRPMKEGFAANCEYFKLGFLDRDMVSLGQQFREILPLLWMKSGAVGKRPEYTEEDEPLMLILPENHFAVLVEEDAYSTFAKEVRKYDTIDTIYFVTNSESAYHEMSEDIGCRDTYQLYRDYIDNFVIGARRDRI